MKHEGGEGIVADLDKLSLPPGRPAARAQHEETRNYLRNNVHRMDYPTYVRNGWSIGPPSFLVPPRAPYSTPCMG